MIDIRVYTHPACRSCEDALNAAKDYAEKNDEVEVKLISLASDEGRETAKENNVVVVPTVQIGDESMQGVPTEEDLDGMMEKAEAAA